MDICIALTNESLMKVGVLWSSTDINQSINIYCLEKKQEILLAKIFMLICFVCDEWSPRVTDL